MTESGPSHTHPLMIHVKVGTKTLGKQISHQVNHGISGKRLAALDPLMSLQFKTRQDRHLKEIPEEIPADRFLDQRQLEIFICDSLQQMSAHHGLVEIGGYLSDKEGIIRVYERLIFPRQIRVH